MHKNRGQPPRQLFAAIAIGALVDAGINIGIMSVEGIQGMRLALAIGFGLLGLLMFWGVYARP